MDQTVKILDFKKDKWNGTEMDASVSDLKNAFDEIRNNSETNELTMFTIKQVADSMSQVQ